MRRTFGLPILMATVLAAVLCLAAFGDSFKLVTPVASGTLEYSDEFARISLVLSREAGYYRSIGLTLENLSSDVVSIDWNKSSITLPSGEVSNVIHDGMDLADAGDYAAPTSLPPGTKAVTSVSPTSNVRPSTEGWQLVPMQICAGSVVGLYLVVTAGGEDRGYDLRLEATEIVDPQPIAYFESGVTELDSIRVVATRSPDPQGVEASYSWDFGDGSAGVSGRMQNHTYTDPGTYMVTLLVTDSWGRTASFAKELLLGDASAQEMGDTPRPARDLVWRKLAFFSLLGMIALAFIATEPIRWLW